MSRDDFEFDDDLFGDEDEEGFEDEEFDFGDDFGFEDEEDFEDFEDIGDFEDEDEDFFEEEVGERAGPSRTFVFLAAAMIVVFAIGLILLALLFLRDTGPDEIDLTSTAIVQLNATTEFNATQTAVQSTEDAIARETQMILDAQSTQTAEAEASATAVAQSLTAEAEATGQVLTATAQAQATFEEMTRQTPSVVEDIPTPTEAEPITAEPVGGVAQTATFIAQQLLTPISVTEEGVGVGGVPTATPIPLGDGELPRTGLFDGVAGGEGMGMVMLLAVGLIGVIFGARRLRSLNSE